MRGLFAIAPISATVAALALAGCGEDRDGTVTTQTGTGTETTATATTPTGAPVATVSVSETEYSLDPANPTVDKAGVVEFEVKNDGKVTHALEVEGPEGEVETENIAPGKSATLKADLSKAGRYVWYCPVGNHEDLGMKGEITVAGGGSGGGGATAPEAKTESEEESGGSGY
jgi:uncharacterized cupredoxin-like copper-binding protein